MTDERFPDDSGDVLAGADDRELASIDAEELLRRAVEQVSSARLMPLSASAMINKDEVLELLEAALQRLPVELRDARWLQKEREEYLARMRLDGEEILQAASARAERMVQRTEVVKAAEQKARRIVETAEAEARRMKRACEDYCDQKLAGFEAVLERTHRVVAAGRQKLQVTHPPPPPAEPESDQSGGLFDQDRSSSP